MTRSYYWFYLNFSLLSREFIIMCIKGKRQASTLRSALKYVIMKIVPGSELWYVHTGLCSIRRFMRLATNIDDVKLLL